jgi:hypothetical protein
VVYEGVQTTHAKGDFWGDAFEIGISNFELEFYTTKFNDEGIVTGDGHYMMLDFLAEDPTTDFPPNIAPGKYPAGTETEVEKYKKSTFIPTVLTEDGGWDSGSIFAEVKDGKLVEPYIAITGGYFELTQTAVGQYTVILNLELANGTTFKGYHLGEIKVKNNKYQTTIDGDLEIPKITDAGAISFYGPNYNNAQY